MQSIVSYGIAFWVTLLIPTHIKKLHTTLNSFVRYIIVLCKILNIKYLHIMHVFAVVFKYINAINTPTHNYNTIC